MYPVQFRWTPDYQERDGKDGMIFQQRSWSDRGSQRMSNLSCQVRDVQKCSDLLLACMTTSAWLVKRSMRYIAPAIVLPLLQR